MNRKQIVELIRKLELNEATDNKVTVVGDSALVMLGFREECNQLEVAYCRELDNMLSASLTLLTEHGQVVANPFKHVEETQPVLLDGIRVENPIVLLNEIAFSLGVDNLENLRSLIYENYIEAAGWLNIDDLVNLLVVVMYPREIDVEYYRTIFKHRNVKNAMELYNAHIELRPVLNPVAYSRSVIDAIIYKIIESCSEVNPNYPKVVFVKEMINGIPVIKNHDAVKYFEMVMSRVVLMDMHVDKLVSTALVPFLNRKADDEKTIQG